VNRLESGAEHEIYWDGRNDRGEDVSSGVYFYSLKADDRSATKKMVLLK
jgi:flagellar hook assembly protein FlgD